MAKVNFQQGTLSQYDLLDVKDANTLYFLTDAKKIMKGDVDVTENIVVVTNFEGTAGGISVENAFEGKLYMNITTFECRIKNGDAWVILTPGYLTDSANWAEADSKKFATIGLIKKAITEAIEGITGGSAFISGLSWTAEAGNGEGKLVIERGDGGSDDVVLTGLPYKFAYDSDQLTITVSTYGGEPTIINLPKDNFVRSGRYEENATLPDPPGGTGPAIILVVNDGSEEAEEKEIVIPAESLVDVYTANNGNNDVVVTISESNEISAVVKIDPAEGNALVTSASGLKVDTSNKLNVYSTGNANEVVLSTANGTSVTRSGATILLDPDNDAELGTSQTMIPVASVIARAIATAQSNLTSLINGKLDSLGTGAADQVITSTATGSIQRSGKAIGGETLAEDPNANTVATEAAVAAAIQDATISWSTI